MSSFRTPTPEPVHESELEDGPRTQRARVDAPRAARTSPEEPESAPESRASARNSRVAERSSAEAPIAPEDTLLSLPAPAAWNELDLSQRVDDLRDRVAQLTQRLQLLESAERRPLPESVGPIGMRWLVWIVFLIALGVTWHVFKR